MDLFKVQSLNEAGALLRNEFSSTQLVVEEIPVSQALGRIVAQEILANDPVPHFTRSVVDGYGVCARDTTGAGESVPVFLTIIGQVDMGKSTEVAVTPGTAVYVPTGGMLPSGADSVVMIEYAETFGADSIAVYKSVAPAENTLGKGEDIPEKSILVPAGRRLRPQDIGCLVASGVATVPVYQKIRVTVLSTGDEIISPELKPEPGQIRDINTYTLSALVEDFGGEVVSKAVIPDDFPALKAAMEEALLKSDMVLLSGGSSVGVRDYSAQVMESFEGTKILTHGLAIKPGKPTIVARVQNKPVFGLPGQPAAAMIVFKALVEPFMGALTGEQQKISTIYQATAAVNIPSAPGRTTFQMVTLKHVDGVLVASPVYGKSGMISLISNAQGYVTIDARKEGIRQGEAVQVVLF